MRLNNDHQLNEMTREERSEYIAQCEAAIAEQRARVEESIQRQHDFEAKIFVVTQKLVAIINEPLQALINDIYRSQLLTNHKISN